MTEGTFWDQRFETHGHTGWANPQLYRHDQPIRLRAVRRALDELALPSGSGVDALDLGCGTGDVVGVLADRGWNVLGVDVSEKVVESARLRFAARKNVRLEVAAVEDLPEEVRFDVVTSVTVLQHLVEEDTLRRAVAAIGRALKPGGHFLLLELSPATPRPAPAGHVAARTPAEWERLVGTPPLRLVDVRSFPQAAVTLLTKGAAAPASPGDAKPAARPSALRGLAKRAVLAASWPFDHLLRLPTPGSLAPYHLFVFRKEGGV